MPPRKSVPAPEPEPVEEPEEAPAVDLNEPVVEPEVADVPEEVPAEPEVVADEAAAEETGVDVGLSPGEEFISQRLRDDAVLVVVTNYGRKIEIDPDGKMTVVTGPPLDVIIPAEPVSTAVGVLGPRPEAG